MEAAVVFDKAGDIIHWHLPPNRSGGAIPDSGELWKLLWDHRERLGGVAHTHPWNGEAHPSSTDVTTFAAIEAGLGRRLVWPIVTFTQVAYYAWHGPSEHDYGAATMGGEFLGLHPEDVNKLRELSR